MSEPVISRCILVPIDLHGVNPKTLDTLVRIARLLDRRLLGVLLEDIRLQRVAELPFATEITLDSGSERRLQRDHLSRRHSLISADIRRQLDELARRNQVEISFEDALGARLASLVNRQEQLDIFLPPRRRWRERLAGSGARRWPVARLGILLPDDPAATGTLAAAAALIRADLVGDSYVLARRAPSPEQLHPLYRPGHQVRLQAGFDYSPAALEALIRRCPYDLLLLPGGCLKLLPPERLESALEESGAEVLIIN